MEIKNLKAAQDVIDQLAWYEKKLNALDNEKLSINLVENQNTLMTIGATVENESFYGVLAVEFADGIKKQLKREIKSLRKQLAALSLNKNKHSEEVTQYSFGGIGGLI